MNLAIWIKGETTGTKTQFLEGLMPLISSNHQISTFSDGSQIIQSGSVPEQINHTLHECTRGLANRSLFAGNPAGTELNRRALQEIADKYAVSFQLTSLLADHFAAMVPILDTIPNLVDLALMPRRPSENTAAATPAATVAATEKTHPPTPFEQVWSDIMSLLTRDPSLSRYLFHSNCTQHSPHGRISLGGTLPCIIVVPRELYAAYEKDCLSRGTTPALSLTNWKAQCKRMPWAWINPPADSKHQTHHLHLGGLGRNVVWILRFDYLPKILKSILSPLAEEHAKAAAQSITGRSREQIARSFESLKRCYIKDHRNGPMVESPAANFAREEAPLAFITAGLIYPRDGDYLNFLAKKLTHAIRAIGSNDESFATREARLQDLRLLAKKYHRSDRELIESICAFSRIHGLTPGKLVEAVSTSLRFSAIAERDSLEEGINFHAAATNDRHIRATAAIERIHECLKTTEAGLRITPSQGRELCKRIMSHATLAEP